METVRVLLADDHALVRAGIHELLKRFPWVEVVGETGDGREALEQIKSCQPDVVLMDVAMPGLNGLEATARVTKEYPYTRVIILSMYDNEEYVIQALRAGAAGYLLKDAATGELEFAIRTVAKGSTYLSPAISKRVIDDYLHRLDNDNQSSLEQLTPRQREILQLVAEGKTTKEIAQILKVSTKTIETHRTNLMERLDIHDVAGLVRYAIREGLVSVER